MRLIAVLVMVFGAALAGGALFFVNKYWRNFEASLAGRDSAPQIVRVLAAKKPLAYGDVLTFERGKDVLRWVEWPAKAVPDGAITTEEQLVGKDRDLSRTVLRTIEPGELVLESKLTGFGETARIATQVSDGMRAVAIPVDAVSGVAGFVAPGDRVDIILLRRIQNKTTSSVVLQDVLVIATDQTADRESGRVKVARTATVEVTPTEAQKLIVAQQEGKLSLTLRGVNESQEIEPTAVDVDDLPDQPAAAAAPAPAPGPTTVRVRKGIEVEVVPVQ